ncbi:MAG: hypothetical protein FWD29_09550 [Micrococcales bacterium]|nr:hypothetical protein [Micrococcales bacterium]
MKKFLRVGVADPTGLFSFSSLAKSLFSTFKTAIKKIATWVRPKTKTPTQSRKTTKTSNPIKNAIAKAKRAVNAVKKAVGVVTDSVRRAITTVSKTIQSIIENGRRKGRTGSGLPVSMISAGRNPWWDPNPPSVQPPVEQCNPPVGPWRPDLPQWAKEDKDLKYLGAYQYDPNGSSEKFLRRTRDLAITAIGMIIPFGVVGRISLFGVSAGRGYAEDLFGDRGKCRWRHAYLSKGGVYHEFDGEPCG